MWAKGDLEWLKQVPAERGKGLRESRLRPRARGMQRMSLINYVPEMALTTKVDEFLNWTRKSSVWYMLFGLACCAIEMMQTRRPARRPRPLRRGAARHAARSPT